MGPPREKAALTFEVGKGRFFPFKETGFLEKEVPKYNKTLDF
jgi:hypothetical protein